MQVVFIDLSTHPDTIRAFLVNTLSWDFVFDVVRTYNLNRWSQSDVYANWAAFFNRYI